MKKQYVIKVEDTSSVVDNDFFLNETCDSVSLQENAKLYDTAEEAQEVIDRNIFMSCFVTEALLYDVVFNESQNSNSKGFSESFDYCKSYIDQNNGTNNSYFADYKGGIVSIICSDGETVFETEVK